MGQLTLIPTSNPTLFDYAALDRPTEVAARTDAALIKGLMRRTAEDLIEIGNALIRQKGKLPHGSFHKWIEAECELSVRTAQRCMNVAAEFGSKYAAAAHLGVMALDMLASAEPDVRAEVERRVAAGELVNADDVRALKAQFNDIEAKALDLERVADQVREENRDLMANAHRIASAEAEQKYSSLIDDLQKRAQLAGETAAASIHVANADAAASLVGEAVVLPFTPRDTDAQITEPDPLGDDGVDEVDLNDMRVGAHVIYGSLSSIDLANTTPEIFWTLFGTKNGKAGTVKWLTSTIKKLKAIKKGMPQ